MTVSNAGGSNTCGPANVVVAPLLTCDGNAQTYSSGTYTVPAYSSIIVEAWGGGASGGGANGMTGGVAGNSGTQSSFSGVVAGGGVGPGVVPGIGFTSGQGGATSGGDVPPSQDGGDGSDGSVDFCPYARSGDGGSSPNGGAGGAGISTAVPSNPGSAPGGGGGGGLGVQYQPQQRLWYCRGAPGGGAGAYTKKTYSAGDLTPGSALNIVVGSGGAAPSAAGPGGAGAAGQVKVTCSTTPLNSAPTTPEISGPTSGFTKTDYTYSFQSTDPDSDTIHYYVDWSGEEDLDSGEGEWVPANPPYSVSGVATSTTHSWNSSNTQTFTVLAEDSQGNRSDWTSYTVNMSPNAPTVLLTATPDSIGSGDSSLLEWSSDNATSCTGTNFSTSGNTDGTTSVSRTQTTTYTVTCTGAGGEASDSATVTYTCTTSYSCSGQNVINNCTGAVVQTCSYQCGGGACIAPPPPETVSGGGFSGALQAVPSLIRSGDPTKLYWNINYVSACTITGGGISWSGATAGCDGTICTSGSSGKQTNDITQRTTYFLSCTGLDTSATSSSATVNILPVFREI